MTPEEEAIIANKKLFVIRCMAICAMTIVKSPLLFNKVDMIISILSAIQELSLRDNPLRNDDPVTVEMVYRAWKECGI